MNNLVDMTDSLSKESKYRIIARESRVVKENLREVFCHEDYGFVKVLMEYVLDESEVKNDESFVWHCTDFKFRHVDIENTAGEDQFILNTTFRDIPHLDFQIKGYNTFFTLTRNFIPREGDLEEIVNYRDRVESYLYSCDILQLGHLRLISAFLASVFNIRDMVVIHADKTEEVFNIALVVRRDEHQEDVMFTIKIDLLPLVLDFVALKSTQIDSYKTQP